MKDEKFFPLRDFNWGPLEPIDSVPSQEKSKQRARQKLTQTSLQAINSE